MDLFEYQARELFAKHGVPVLKGIVATTPEEAKAAAEEIGGLTVIKAQVKTGGRGKAGGVKLAKSPEEAYEHAKAILGMDIKGHTVHRVLVADGADIAEEYYFSLLLDRANRSYLAMCSVEGGMEIEQLAAERPRHWQRSRLTRWLAWTRLRLRKLLRQQVSPQNCRRRLFPFSLSWAKSTPRKTQPWLRLTPSF